MKKEVKIAEFKSRLSEYLRAVRRGQEIVVKDRDTPIARVIRYDPPRQRLVTIPPTRTLREVAQLLAGAKRPRNLKPGELEEVLREVRRDVMDKGLV